MQSINKKIMLSTIFLTLTIALICFSSVFAWVIFRHEEPLGSVTAAKVLFSSTITIDDSTQTVNQDSDYTNFFNIDNLAYLDLTHDVTNTNKVFNRMVNVVNISIINNGYVPLTINISTTVKLIISNSEYSTNGLLYMYVPYTYINESQETVELNDYYTYLNEILPLNPTDQSIRDAINTNNNNFFDNVVLSNINDSFSFKVILIGDYNNLSDSNHQEQTNYLTNSFKIYLNLNINQQHN